MANFYQTLLNKIHQSPYLKNIIIFICKYFPDITFTLYPCILIYLFFTKSPLLLSTILRPLSAFILVSIFRKIINRPRPYESMSIEPLLSHKSGESFPSRHTLSAFIIAFVCFDVNIALGIFACIIAIIISLTRILAGVHYISDVISAIIVAYIFYII